MNLRILAAIAAITGLITTAEAKSFQEVTQFCGDRVCEAVQEAKASKGYRRTKDSQKRYAAPPARAVDGNGNVTRGVSLAGIVAPLANKAQEIMADCGSKVISAFRRGARIPTGQVSNHAVGRAVDMQGNPECIYAHLRNWPGGYSTDYHRAPGGKHVHISYNPGGMEWGVRFAHRGGWPRKVATTELSATPTYADNRDRGGLATHAVMDDGSRKGKFKSLKSRRASIALQRHAARVH